MRTEPRRRARVTLISALAVVCAAAAPVAAANCIDGFRDELIANGGGLATGSCDESGRFVLVAVESRDGGGDAASYEMARARALRDLSSFFDSNVSASEVVEEWERATIENGQETIEAGTSYRAEFSSSTESFLKGLQLYSHTRNGDSVWITYILTASSITLARELEIVMAPPATSEDEDGIEKLVRVEARGFASVGSDGVPGAREQAIDRALTQAITQVLGVIVGSTVTAADFQDVESEVFSHSVGFVEHYDILEEGLEDGSYQVLLQATVTANKLYDGYEAYLQELESPRFWVDAQGDKMLAKPFLAFVSGLGIELTESKNDASYVVRLRAEYSDLNHPVEKIPGLRCTMTVAVLQADDGSEIFSHANNPRKAVSFSGDPDRQRAIIVDKAFRSLREDLHDSLNKLIVDMARHGRRINAYFDIDERACRESYLELERALDGSGGIRKATLVIDDKRGLYVLRMRYVGEGSELAELILSRINSWTCTSRRFRISYMNPSEIWFTGRN
jgi:hypothetical protein